MEEKFYKTKKYLFSAEKCKKSWGKSFNGFRVKMISSDFGELKIDRKVSIMGIPRAWCNEI